MHAHNVGFFFLAFVETLFSIVFGRCDELTLLVMFEFLVYHVSNFENLMLARAYVRHTWIDDRFLLCIVHEFDWISGQIRVEDYTVDLIVDFLFLFTILSDFFLARCLCILHLLEQNLSLKGRGRDIGELSHHLLKPNLIFFVHLGHLPGLNSLLLHITLPFHIFKSLDILQTIVSLFARVFSVVAIRLQVA